MSVAFVSENDLTTESIVSAVARVSSSASRQRLHGEALHVRDAGTMVSMPYSSAAGASAASVGQFSRVPTCHSFPTTHTSTPRRKNEWNSARKSEVDDEFTDPEL